MNSRIFFFFGHEKKWCGGKIYGIFTLLLSTGFIMFKKYNNKKKIVAFSMCCSHCKITFFCKSHISTDLIGVQLKVIEKQNNLLQMLCCFYYNKLFFFTFFSLLSNWAIFKTNIRVYLLKRTKEINSAWWCTQYSDHDNGGIYQYIIKSPLFFTTKFISFIVIFFLPL